MNTYRQLAEKIVEEVGGKSNIVGLWQCITRLRFRLKDESLAHDDVLKSMQGVITVKHAAGQYQVVIGPHVGDVFEDVIQVIGKTREELGASIAEEAGKQNLFDRFVDIVSGCFQPILSILIASGLTKGLNELLLYFSLYEKGSGASQVFAAVGDAFFMFIPIFLGVSAARKFNIPDFLGLVLGAVLCYPSLQLDAQIGKDVISTFFDFKILGTPMAQHAFSSFFGIPLVAGRYLSSVIPIIIIIWFASYVHKFAQRLIPKLIANFFVPFLVLIIAAPIGLLVIGPVFAFIQSLLTASFSWLINISGILYGIFIGMLWQIMVIFGMHWALLPVYFTQIATEPSAVISATFAASFGQLAVIAAMFLKFKNTKDKALVPPAAIAALVGITEPAIYGISLPRKKPFYFSLIAAGAGGAVIGSVPFNTAAGLGVFGFTSFLETSINGTIYEGHMATAVIAVLVAMVVGFTLTYLFWNDDPLILEQDNNDITNKQIISEGITSPLSGRVLALSEAKDIAFAEGHMGKGVVIEPNEEGIVYAPFSGIVQVLFPSKHAIGLESDNGAEILIHVGMDTVQLNGKHFTAYVTQNQRVKQGDKLISFNKAAIEEAGFSTQTPVIITNTDAYKEVNAVIPIDPISAGVEIISVITPLSETSAVKTIDNQNEIVSGVDGDIQIVASPMAGRAIPLEKATDDTFSSGALGIGIAIKPTGNDAYAPFSGEITALFKHAIGITSKDGLEALIHIGVNTVYLRGKFFETYVKQGDLVEKGDKLMSFDRESIEATGYSVESTIIITNTKAYSKVLVEPPKNLEVGDTIIKIIT